MGFPEPIVNKFPKDGVVESCGAAAGVGPGCSPNPPNVLVVVVAGTVALVNGTETG